MPKTIENVITEGFSLVKNNYLEFLSLYVLFAAIFAVIIVIGVILLLLAGVASSSGTGLSGAELASIIFFAIVIFAVIFLVEPLWVGSYYAIALQCVNGGKISILEAVGKAKDRYISLLWTMALESFLVIIIDIIIFSPLLVPAEAFFSTVGTTGSLSGSTAAVGAFLGLLALGIVVVVVFLIVNLALAPLLYEAVPLVMIENVRGVKALKESIALGRNNFWKLILLFIIFGIALGIIYVGQEIVVFIFSILGTIAGSLIGVIISLLVGAFTNAWLNVLPIIFYNDFLSKKA